MSRTIGNNFNSKSTASQVLTGVDLSDQLIVLTGATSGIGIATAEALASRGADIVIGARNPEKLNQLLNRLQVIKPGIKLYGYKLDLMSVESIDIFADSVIALNRPIKTLITNAGGLSSQLVRNHLGIESQLMTNFLGHAILVSRLAKSLKEANGARVVSVASVGHHYSPVVIDDMNFDRRPYDIWQAYGQSKTASVLLAVKVKDAMNEDAVDAYAVHPGIITTEINKDLSDADMQRARDIGAPNPQTLKTLEQGAATTVWAATNGNLRGRSPLYLEDCNIAETLTEPTFQNGVMQYALCSNEADQLWRATEQLINRPLPL